ILLFVLVHLLLNGNNLLHFRQTAPSLAATSTLTLAGTPTPTDSVDDQRRESIEAPADRLSPVNNDNEQAQAELHRRLTSAAKCDINAILEPSASVDALCDLTTADDDDDTTLATHPAQAVPPSPLVAG